MSVSLKEKLIAEVEKVQRELSRIKNDDITKKMLNAKLYSLTYMIGNIVDECTTATIAVDQLNMNPFLIRLLEDGLCMELSMVNGERVYDLHTGMKSDCEVIDKGNGILHLLGRYGWEEDYDTNEESYESFIQHIYDKCSHGRSYCSVAWSDIFEKYGTITKSKIY